jgi:hypothetical protein
VPIVRPAQRHKTHKEHKYRETNTKQTIKKEIVEKKYKNYWGKRPRPRKTQVSR